MSSGLDEAMTNCSDAQAEVNWSHLAFIGPFTSAWSHSTLVSSSADPSNYWIHENIDKEEFKAKNVWYGDEKLCMWHNINLRTNDFDKNIFCLKTLLAAPSINIESGAAKSVFFSLRGERWWLDMIGWHGMAPGMSSLGENIVSWGIVPGVVTWTGDTELNIITDIHYHNILNTQQSQTLYNFLWKIFVVLFLRREEFSVEVRGGGGQSYFPVFV